MKLLSAICLFLLMLLPIFAWGQFEPTEEECSLVTRVISDELLGTKRYLSKSEIRVNDLNSGDLFQLVMTRDQETFSFIIRGVGKHCFDNKSEVEFIFRNGASVKFTTKNKTNCESLLLVNMGGIYRKEDVYGDFLNQYIIGLKFKSSDGTEHRLKIETPQTEMIHEVFECLIVSE